MSIAEVSRSAPGVFNGCGSGLESNRYLIYSGGAWRRHVFQVGVGSLILQEGGNLFRIDGLHQARSRFVVRENERSHRFSLRIKEHASDATCVVLAGQAQLLKKLNHFYV